MKHAFAAGLMTVALLAPNLDARITRIVIDHKESPAYEGQSFGEAGRYERLTGHAYGELDPKDPLNAIITDLQLAPRNARGMVEYSATFLLAKPVDMAHASGVLLYEVPNRGNSALLRLTTNPGAIADYFRRGHVVLASGWQGDIPAHEGVETIAVPMAKNTDGSSVTGPVLARFSDMPANTTTLALAAGGVPRPLPASLDTSKAILTRRVSEGNEIIPIKSADWAFGDCTKAPFPGNPDPSKVCLKGGFNPAFLYELTYTGKNPLVLGIGYAATRDLNAYFKSGDSEALGHKISYAIAWGNSQSCAAWCIWGSIRTNPDASCGTGSIPTSRRASLR